MVAADCLYCDYIGIGFIKKITKHLTPPLVSNYYLRLSSCYINDKKEFMEIP